VSGLQSHQVEVTTTDGRPTFTKVVGSDEVIKADLVLLALGFTGPELSLIDPKGSLGRSPLGTIPVDAAWMTSVPGIFATGDARRGQSLIVWAIAEGRSAAASVDRYLMGYSDLPAPVEPSAAALRA
jgi:glutamate synthase (NADPH/NADH) small chain